MKRSPKIISLAYLENLVKASEKKDEEEKLKKLCIDRNDPKDIFISTL